MRDAIAVPLCVVGGGPTGVAALLEAKRQGLEAIGLEAGTKPLNGIASHQEGLVYLSEASHFEVGGLPLDCRDSKRCTREDVLRYYTRIINSSGLSLRVGWRCADLTPQDSGVLVTVDTPAGRQYIRARDVLVTAWYQRRPFGVDQPVTASAPNVIQGFGNPSELAGQSVAVVGGGRTGFELATTLMMAGARISLLLRGARRPIHLDPSFTAVVAATRSVVYEAADDVRLCAGGVTFFAEGVPMLVGCDTVVCATGAILDPSIMAMLVKAAVFSPDSAEQLAAAPTFEQSRFDPFSSIEARIHWVAARRPDLWDQLFVGVAGIRVAGGILHGGGQHAGVVVSTATARLAVRAILGMSPPCWERPLPIALTRVDDVARSAGSSRDFDVVETIRPFCTPTQFCHAIVAGDGNGRFDGTTGALARAIMSLADGETSLRDMLNSDLCRSVGSSEMLRTLKWLFYHDRLTWLPPKA